MRLDRQITDDKRGISLKNPERFILPVMHMQWSLHSRRFRYLDNAHEAPGIRGCRLDHRQAA
jgi:hypothetical protein